MKKTISILMMAVMLYSCGNSSQNKTQEEAKQLAAGIQKMMPGGIPTTAGGWTMTAKIGGRDWTASSIMPPEETGRIVSDNNGEKIGLPYDRRYLVVGKKIKFSDHNAVDLFTNDEVAVWGGYVGEMEITKVEADWVEGKFFVTGKASFTDTSRRVEITDGFFRISIA